VELGLIIIYKLQFQVVSIGESNFSDHGANRGASALMQGLADGYFVLPYTIGDYLSPDIKKDLYLLILQSLRRQKKESKSRLKMNNNGTHSVDYFHRKLGKIMWDKVGMARNAEGLNQAIVEIAALREEFYKDVKARY
jgi:succinate dehydrogenase / fumarate reductase flavoprotein subunit